MDLGFELFRQGDGGDYNGNIAVSGRRSCRMGDGRVDYGLRVFELS